MTFKQLLQRLDEYEKLMRLDKPIGWLLLLWPTYWGLWFSMGAHPPWLLLLIFTVGTILMRSAGCVINDYADRDFDRHVARTQDRPLTAGRVSTREALILAAMLVIASFCLILPLNRLVLWLSIPALFLAASYPFTKRFFAIPQAYLGIAFSFGIPMAYAAVANHVPLEAWLLVLGNLCWTVAYDTEYAMVDREDDLKIGIKTSAITFGQHDVAIVMACYGAAVALIGWVGHRMGRGPLFWLGLVAALGVAVYHYTLIRDRDRARCFKAFRHNNWFGFLIFLGLALDYWIEQNGLPF